MQTARAAHARRRPTNRFGQIRGLHVLARIDARPSSDTRKPVAKTTSASPNIQEPVIFGWALAVFMVALVRIVDHGGRRGLAGLQVRELGVVGVRLLGHGWSRCGSCGSVDGGFAAGGAAVPRRVDLNAAVDAVDAAAAWLAL